MDEAIGAKGGKNDRRRSIMISQNKKKKLDEAIEDREIKELEKKVKKKQIYTLIKTLPIVIGGGVIKTIYDISKVDVGPNESKKEANSNDEVDFKQKDSNRKKKIITTPDGKKVVVYLDLEHFGEKNVDDEDKKGENSTPKNANNGNDISNDKTSIDGVNNPTFVPANSKPKKTSTVTSNESSFYYDDLDFNNLPDFVEEKFQKLRARKIIDEYEKQLKDIRFELRRVIYDYNVLVDEDEKAILSDEAQVILDKLSEIISRIEVLKSKLRVEDLDKYDDNYIYYLVEGYLNEFKDGRLVSEIKDSPLYVMISKKIDELEKKRDDFDKKVSDKKDELEDREKDFEELKKKYSSIDRINADLLRFQYDQDMLLSEIKERVRTATSVKERVETQVVGLNKQSSRLLRLLSLQLFLPGPRSAKTIAATTAAYLYFYNNIVKPNTVVKKYRVISVKDYHDDIVNSINSLDDAQSLLKKTSKQIDKTIRDIEDRFADYIGVIPECDELLRNLRKVKSELMEKEYEMEKIRKQQEAELEKNDAKVKTIGEYPVN